MDAGLASGSSYAVCLLNFPTVIINLVIRRYFQHYYSVNFLTYSHRCTLQAPARCATSFLSNLAPLSIILLMSYSCTSCFSMLLQAERIRSARSAMCYADPVYHHSSWLIPLFPSNHLCCGVRPTRSSRCCIAIGVICKCHCPNVRRGTVQPMTELRVVFPDTDDQSGN
jgi:hypothetical protein